MSSSSHKSRENLLSSRAFCRSEPVLADRMVEPSRKKIGIRSCVCGGDGGTESTKDMATAVQTEEQQLKKILIILGFGHLLVFGAVSALQTLQSSLFLETKFGLIAFCTVYSCAVVSGFYGPAFVQKFTPNWTVVLASVVVALFLSAFFYPRLYTLIPPAIILGLVMGPLFCAQTTFLMTSVSRISYLTDEIREKIQRKHLSLFSFFWNSSRIWGQLVVALLVRHGGDIYVFFTQPEPTFRYRFPYGINPKYAVAGEVDMVPSPYATVVRPSLCTLDKLSEDGVFRGPTSYVFILPLNLTLMLVAVFLGMTFLGVAVVTTLLDKCELYQTIQYSEKISCLQQMKKVASIFVDPYFKFMFPFILFMGLEQGFISADFTRSYVSCALDLETVAYTIMAMATVNTIASMAVHVISKYIRAVTIMSVGVVCQSGLLMVLWLWVPVRDDVAIFYIIATGWGLCHAIWETLITTHIMLLYPEDWQAPFAAYFATHSMGLAAAFGWSAIFVTEIKIYILAGTLATSIVPYVVLELRMHQKRKEQERVVQL